MAATPHKAGQIPSLDGLRALAIAIVFAAHANLPTPIFGSAGVTIFFFLSGYLITTLLRIEHDRTGRISLGDFYMRRALRIFPSMYIALGACVVVGVTGAIAEAIKPWAVFTAAGYVTNYRIIISGRHGLPTDALQLWSLAVEEHFYLLFPLLYISLLRATARRAVHAATLSAICAAVLVWRCYLVFGRHDGIDRLYLATDTRLDSILIGCLLAVAANPVIDRLRGGYRVWTYGLLPAGALVFVVVSRAPFRIESSVGYTIEGLALAPVFVALIAYPESLPGRILNLRGVAFVGVLSYSIYLQHRLFILLVQRHFDYGKWPNAATAALLVLGGSYAIYRLVERPMARLRKRFSHAGESVEFERKNQGTSRPRILASATSIQTSADVEPV